MEGLVFEAEKLGVDPAWLVAKSMTIGQGRCPQCWPENDIIAEGNYIEPCGEHSGTSRSLASPDDPRVTVPVVDIIASVSYV